jgi:uncharacterized repeat protein (TIGR01451 family)
MMRPTARATTGPSRLDSLAIADTPPGRRRCAFRGFASLTSIGLALLCFGIASPSAQAATPAWTVHAFATPSRVSPVEVGAGNRYQLIVLNSGDEASTPGVTVTDRLPAGLTGTASSQGQWSCSEDEEAGLWIITCTLEESVAAGAYAPYLEIGLSNLSQTSGSLLNEVSVNEGGAVVPSTTTVNTPIVSGIPPFGLTDFSMQFTGSDGRASSRAGGNPWQVMTSFGIPVVFSPPNSFEELFTPVQNLKKVVVELPLGFAGNPRTTEHCTQIELRKEACPPGSRIGSFAVAAGEFGTPHFFFTGHGGSPVFNMVTEPGYPAEFAITYLQQSVFMYATVVHSASGERLRITVPGVPPILESMYISLTIWGEPGQLNGSGSKAAFLTNPSDCADAASPARIELESWESTQPVSAEAIPYLHLEGCDELSFEPSFSLLPETAVADSPTGLNVDLNIPQTAEFEERATPQLRDATVTLPEGLNADPALADGLVACPATGPEGINLGSSVIGSFGQDLGNPFATELGAGHLGGNASPYDDGVYHTTPGHCPGASTLGTAEVTSPVVSEPLLGHVYLGAPDCSPCSNQDAAEGKLIKLYLEVAGDGVIAKLPGTVSADPSTGRLTAHFVDNPQLPFEDLKLHFFGGPRAALSTPPTCGTYATTTDLKPWSAPGTPDATPTSSFEIGIGPGGGACATTPAQAPNAPAFTAGTLTPAAGAYSPFVLSLARPDGSQRLKAIDTTLPAGLVAKLAGVGECSEAQIVAAANHSGKAEQASPSCPLGTEVGTVDVAAGAGPNPFHVQGHAYLAGPYKSAPLSLAIITPAVAGPFDLGTVVVRVALHVDPETAVVTAKSDPLPQILTGIPLDLRSVAVNLSRPNFTLNPTNCNKTAVTGSALSVLDQSAALSSPFQVGGCSALGFKPKLSVHLKGGTRRAKNPALRATLTYPKGAYANIARAQVTLPHSEFLDQSHIKTICTRVQFAAGAGNGEQCPAASIYGHASAITPLLDNPIEGPVYLRSSTHKLPDLVAALNGQIDVDLAGKVDTGKGGGIRNTFQVVPDAPVSKFVLSLKGGDKGLLVNSENLCSAHAKTHALAHFVAQNGKVSDMKPLIANDCAAGRSRKKGHRH